MSVRRGRGGSLPGITTLEQIWRLLNEEQRDRESGAGAPDDANDEEDRVPVVIEFRRRSDAHDAALARWKESQSSPTDAESTDAKSKDLGPADERWSPIERDRGDLIRDGSLGWLMRALITAAHFDIKASEATDQIRAIAKAGGFGSMKTGYAESHLRLTKGEKRAKTPLEVYDARQLTAVYGDLVDQARQHPNRSLGAHPRRERLFEARCDGPDAVGKYIDVLEERSVTQPFFSELAFVSTQEREELLDRLVDEITSIEANKPLLFNVYGPSPNGLRTFGEELTRRIEQAETKRSRAVRQPDAERVTARNVLFIPLGANYSPSAKNMVLTTGDVAAKLRVFARVGLSDAVAAQGPIEEDASLVSAIDDIRSAMRDRGMIVVIDGLRRRSRSSQSREVLEDLQRDALAGYIVGRLLDPIQRGEEYSMSYGGFLQNRIVALSDGKLEFLSRDAVYPRVDSSGLKDDPPPSGARFFPLSPPPIEQLDELLRTNVRAVAVAPIHELLRTIPREITVSSDSMNTVTPNSSSVPSDQVLQLLDALLALVVDLDEVPEDDHERLVSVATAELTADASGHQEGTLSVEHIVRTVLTYLGRVASRPEPYATSVSLDSAPIRAACWREILMVCAMSPEGIRASTVCRFVERVKSVPNRENYSLLATTELFVCQDLTGEERHPASRLIESLREVVPSIIDLIRIETVRGEDDPDEQYSSLARKYLATLSRQPEGGSTGEATLDYRHVEVRAAVRKVAMSGSDTDRKSVFLAHRLYCEICVQLASIGLRHTGDSVRGEIRQWRRTLSAIYHGLGSLPYDANGRSIENEDENDFGTRDLLVVGGVEGFWNYLLTRLWLSLLDGGREKRVTRLMGLDSVVLDLCTIFNKPAQITGFDGPDQRRWFEIDPEEAVDAPSARRERVVLGRNDLVKIDTSIAAAYSAISRGESTRAWRVLNAFRPTDVASEEDEHPLERLQPIDEYASVLNRYPAFKDPALAGRYGRMLFSLLIEDVRPIKEIDVRGVLKQFPTKEPVPIDALDAQVEPRASNRTGSRQTSDFTDKERWAALYDATGTFVGEVPVHVTNSVCELWWKRYEQWAFLADFLSGGHAGEELRSFGLSADVATRLDALLALLSEEFSVDLGGTDEDRKAAAGDVRLECLNAYSVTEALRAQSAFLHLQAAGSRRTSTQARVAIRLALSLAKDEVEDAGSERFRRHARRLADSMSRDKWRHPRNQSHALVTEAGFVLARPDPEVRQLLRALAKIATARRLIGGHNRRSRAGLRALLMRARVQRRLLEITGKDLYRSNADFDLRELTMLTGSASDPHDRPFWQCLVALEKANLARVLDER